MLPVLTISMINAMKNSKHAAMFDDKGALCNDARQLANGRQSIMWPAFAQLLCYPDMVLVRYKLETW